MEGRNQFEASFARVVAIAGAVVIPPGLLVSGLVAGWRGLAGAFVGFAVASLNTYAVTMVLKWSLGRTPSQLPSILMASYFVRLLLLAGILIGLSFVKALNTLALLSCFLVLYIAHTTTETVLAYKAFGTVLKPTDKGGGPDGL